MSGFSNNSQVTRGGTRGELLNQSPSVEKRTLLASSDAATRLRSAPPPLPRQPSILDLVTAMPLLLSLDRGDDDVLSLDTAEQSVAADGVPHDAYGDAATAAVVAVLRRAGGPSSWQAKHRRRLRRAALDAFFRASLPAQIAARVRAAAASRSSSSSSSSSAAAAEAVTGGLSDGVHYATMRLLHHTRAVMAEVSPTQAHLVDLFADEILRCSCGSGGVAVTATAKRGVGGSRSPEISNQVGEKRWNKRKEAPTEGEVMDDAALSEEAVGSSTLPRSIMKTTTRWSAAGVEEADTATAMSKQESAAACHSQSSSTSVAEQLLYIILRTSVAAKTPLRWDADEEAASECGCLRTPPSQAAGLPDQLLTPSLTNSASSTGSLVRKKPHLDILEDVSGTQAKKSAGPKSPVSAFCEDPAALFRREEEESIRHHHPAKAANTEGAATGGAVLPYEPRCWLGASTVALVERSETLRRQQRWTCERDPVVEATIAGEGVGLYCNYSSSSNSNSRTVVSADLSLIGRRNHWAPIADAAANTADAEAFASIARDSGLPFAVPFSCASHASQEAGALSPSNAGVLHWALEDDEQGRGADPAVQSLFFANGKTDKGATRAVTVADSPTTDAKFKAKSEPSAAPLFLPACRTPFVSCKALYDSVVYAHVYVALHRCAAGLVDPFELTYYETQGGPNLVEIRVRPELYAATAAPPVASTKKPYQQQSARPHSGLTSMLEWGCRCGTLFLRLHRLCAVAEDATLRASLGNYGRCAIDTLQLLLCFLQRQIWELGERAGGWHRLSFTELLTAQQRLQTAAEQVEALAAFFMLPCTSAATPGLAEASLTQEAVVAVASSRRKAKPVPPTWDPVHVLQQHCCSAQLLSRLYQLFTARHANALGQHGSVAVAYAELQRESAEAELSAPETPHRNGPGADNDTAAASVAATHAREQLRKDLLSRSIDAVGLLLSATLRPFNVMLYRWLTTGELADPYDEFFVVPSHGRTHSGFTLDLTPQRLPVFVSAAAASDLLHAGVSLRVLRAAATHVARSAQRDARRLQALAEMTEAAAEDYAEELHDTQTLQVAIEKFIERLVRGAPTAESANVMGRLFRGTDGATAWREEEGSAEEDLPLPPRVDVLSAYGSINWWRQHYQACTQVLLHAVEEAAGEGTELPQDEVEGAIAVEVQTADGAAKSHLPSEPDVTSARGGQNEEKPHTSFSAAEGGAAAANGSSGCSSSPPSPSSSGLRNANKAALARASVAAVQSVEEGGNGNGNGSVVPPQTTPDFSLSAPAHLSYPASLVPVTASVPKEKGNAEEAEELPYITVFINSDDDDDAGIGVHNANVVEHTSTGQPAHRKDAIPLYSSSSSPSLPARSSSSSPASSTAASSVLGLHHIAGSKLSVGTTISSTASSRGTMALYGAITEELRQVSLLQQATEAQAGQSRHALRAEFQAQMWRRRRELRLADWKAQRLALRLRRMRATEGMVEELREVYGIRGAGYADEQQQQQAPLPPVLPVSKAGKSDEEAEGAESEKVAVFATPPANAFRFVVPLRHLPPPAARPPVVLYAEEEEEDLGDRERVGRGRSALRGRERPRRTSFAATATVVELPSQASLPLPPPLTPQHRRSFSSGMPPVHPSGILVPPRAARTRSASGPGFSLTTLSTTRISALQQGEQVVRNEEEEEKGTKEKPCGPPPRGNATTDRRSRSSPASSHTAVDTLRGAAQQRGGIDGEAAADTSASQVASSASGRSRHAGDSGLAADLLALSHNKEQAGTVTLQEQWLRAAALPSISSATGDGGVDARQDTVSGTDEQVRRDELGYAHHAYNYIVADINDDEFFLLRTGPKSYARREAEAAALARLAAKRAALDRCTVDAPDFLEQLQHAAAAHAEKLNRDDLVDREKEDEEEEQAKPTRFSDTRTLFLPSTLSRVWREDDPQDCLRRCDDADDENPDDGTRRLWAWTPAEAHRWYFDYRVPLHRVLTDSEVDHTLLVDLPLTSEEAEALQCCGGYYRELGQYTASFLTHKALQLTLLPPYGALYRLTTQFLDVCLLQNPAAAVRIVDVWIASVDAALEMMAEREEAAMVAAAVAGATHAPATLASLTDQQQGMDLKTALASLNVAFQREWAACVLNGDSTVTLEWKLKDEGKERKTCGDGSHGYGVGWRSTPASPQLGATQLTAEEDDAGTSEGQLDFFFPLSNDDDEDAAVDGAAPFRGWHHGGDLQQSDPKQVNREGDDHADDVRGVEAESGRHQRKTQQRDACTRDKEGSPLPSSFSLPSSSLSRSQASVIQSFLASLELTAVSPWCSGAWLLPDRTLKCLGGICRNLLFWKSAERVMLHMWRAGMNSGLSSAFFFCTTVRQVLLSTLQESLWARLTELTAAYRERLRFEAGVLYTYRALENFTVDHEAFLQDCEFYTLCAAPFQCRVQPLLRAMMREVEVAERALRFAQVSTRVARRQYMATFYFMVGASSSSSSSDSEDVDEKRNRSAAFSTAVWPKHKPASTKAGAAPHKQPHLFTPSRWCRRSARSSASQPQQAPQQATQQRSSTPSYLRPLEDTLARQQVTGKEPQPQQRQDAEKTGKELCCEEGTEEAAPIPCKRATGKQKSKSPSSSVTTQSTHSTSGGLGGVRRRHRTRVTPSGTRSTSALSSSTTTTVTATTQTNTATATCATSEDDGARGSDDSDGADAGNYSDKDRRTESSRSSGRSSSRNKEEEAKEAVSSTKTPADVAATATADAKHTKKKKRRRRTAPAGAPSKKAPPRRSIMESATMNTTPIYAAILVAQEQRRQQQQQAQTREKTSVQKRGRSVGVGVRVPAAASSSLPHQAVGYTSAPAMKRHRDQQQLPFGQGRRRRHRGGPQEPQLTPEEQQERREKLRVIAERKIREETEHQRRLMRDVIARRMRRFAALTQLLRDALSNIIAKEDVLTQEPLTLYPATESKLNNSCGSSAAAVTAAAAKEPHNAQLQRLRRFTYLSSMVRRLDSLIEVMASQV